MRIGHHSGRYYRALCCQVLPSRLLAMDMDSPLGSIIMDGVDVMSPELCRAKEYRDDEHGYYEAQGAASGRLYYCRADRKGRSYDKGVLMAVSHNLGHSRCDVVVSHYL